MFNYRYHLGEFRIPFEKSLPYETDIRPPFYVTGPGVPPGSNITGLVSLMDVGATMLELAGALPPGALWTVRVYCRCIWVQSFSCAGARTTDGRSIVPLLTPGNNGESIRPL